ncbi:MAG: TIGR02300 family protein [Caulobacterales bacterium]|nr:TIGR02300 family protein [Caulobacterales bacterium]MCA0373969.1 TIGR02300 family protein [Pseudomonadota bacterium]
MPKIDLGEKQICPSCAAKFYDLGKRPAKCPKCGNSFDPFDEEILANRQAQQMSSLDLDETPNEDEDDDQAIKVKAVDPDAEEEEIDAEEVTKEIDIENIDEPELIMGDDGDDDGDIPGSSGDPIPEGFSEQELEDDEAAVIEEEVPFLEGDDELFEEELAELDIDEDDPGLA